MDVMLVLLDSELDGMAGLPNLDLKTFARPAVHACSLES